MESRINTIIIVTNEMDGNKDFLCIYIYSYKYIHFQCAFIGHLYRNAYIFLSFAMAHLCQFNVQNTCYARV